jgi:type VI secretion system protein ImpA
MACLDFSKLLAPISVEQIAGKNIRYDDDLAPLYYKIKDARSAARAIERQQIQGADTHAQPNWQIVCNLALEILQTHTKDLEITVWLIEALLRVYGFTGLRDGFHLARRFIELYWEELYPLPAEDGLEERLSPLIGLNGDEAEGTLIAPIALVPLTEGKSIGPFALWQYQQAIGLYKISDLGKRAQREAAGAVTLEKFQRAIAESSTHFLQNQALTLQECLEEYEILHNIISEKCGADAVPSSRIIMQLKACLDCLQTAGKEALANLVSTSEAPQNLSLISSTVEQKTGLQVTTTINASALSRDQVLQTLLEGAEFFRNTEPHSIIPYILERTVRWAKMPLPELLKELLKEEPALNQLSNLTGIGFGEKTPIIPA